MIKIVGDILFSDGSFDIGYGVGSLIEKNYDPFKNIYRKESDFWIGNFECVCSNTSNQKGVYRRQFRIEPKSLSNIKHLDMYGVANNHVMQHGDEAYREMLKYFDDNKIKYVGSKINKSKTFEHQDKKVGVISFSQRPEIFSVNPLYWSLPEYKELESEINKLSLCDFKIAYIHWGNEFINYPYIDQRQFAHWLVDSGIDLIIGMHPHILQGFEIYKEKYIFYSLGNFVFNMPWDPLKYSAIVNVDFNNEKAEVSYDYVELINYFPVVVNEKDIPKEFRFAYLNKLFNDKNIENEKYFAEIFAERKKYRKANYIDIASNLYKMNIIDTYSMLSDFVKRRLNIK